MSFIQHLKPALIRKGGKEFGVLFTNRNKDELIFSGTDNSKSQEPVRITLNGSVINLEGQYLHNETPILKTGKKSVKNKDGTLVDCNRVCYKIITDFMSGKLAQSNQRELIQNNRQYLETKVNSQNKEMEIENLLGLLTSEEMRPKVIDFLKKESGHFIDEIVSEVMEKLSVSISSKRYVASDKHDKNTFKTFSSGTSISLNDITKESFENPQSSLLVCLYNVLYFLQQGSDWKTSTEQTAKLLYIKSGRAVALKCGKEFGGGPPHGGVPAFKKWFESGVMLDKLQENIPNLSENDYEIFKDLLS